MRSLGSLYGIKLLNTAAESHWNNCVCEQLNGKIAGNVRCIMHDSKCNIHVALTWLSVESVQINWFFASNPRCPSVFCSSVPEFEEPAKSLIVADNLNAMHAARREFIRSEANNRVRRALLR